MRKYFVRDLWTKVEIKCGPLLAIILSGGSVRWSTTNYHEKVQFKRPATNTSTLLCSQICTGVLLCYCLAYRLHGDQNVKMYPLRKLETRAFTSTDDVICTFFHFLISFFFLYFSCFYIYSIYIFELCEMWSSRIPFYVVFRLLGCEATYADIKLLTFLSSVTFKRGTEQCSET